MAKALPLLMVSLLLTACGETPPERLKDGKALYDYYCKACHIKEGPGAYFEQLDPDKPRASSTDILMMLSAQRYLSSNPHPHLRLPKLRDEQIENLAQFTLRQRVLKGRQVNKK